jgi:hypothetical protein
MLEPPSGDVTSARLGHGRATLIALACANSPEGRTCWTMQLLADELVAREMVGSISDETVRRELKKNGLKPWLQEHWCIPEVSPAFVAPMEDVLDLYALRSGATGSPLRRAATAIGRRDPYALAYPARPSTTFRLRVPPQWDWQPFTTIEPLAGWRHVEVPDHRSAIDFAHEMKWLVDEAYPEAVVCLTL